MAWAWTQPACDRCWRDENPGPQQPVRLNPEFREPEICVYCGGANNSGIYVRIDPAVAPYPTRERA